MPTSEQAQRLVGVVLRQHDAGRHFFRADLAGGDVVHERQYRGEASGVFSEPAGQARNRREIATRTNGGFEVIGKRPIRPLRRLAHHNLPRCRLVRLASNKRQRHFQNRQ